MYWTKDVKSDKKKRKTTEKVHGYSDGISVERCGRGK